MPPDSPNADTRIGRRRPRPLGAAALLAAVALAGAFVVVGNLFVSGLTPMGDGEAQALRALLARGMATALGLGLAAWGVLWMHGRRARELRLRPRDFLRRAGMAAVYEAVVLSFMPLWLLLAKCLELEPEPSLLESMFSHGAATALDAALLIVVLAPLAEEFFFRGVLQAVFTRWTGRRGGMVLSALAFALMHGLWSFAPMFWMGLVLAHERRRGASLSAPIMTHALHNALILLVLAFGR